MPELPSLQGLTSAEAAARLKAFGRNELPSRERRNAAHIVFDVMRQPMFALLLCGGIIYLFLGDALDATVLLVFATLSVSISVVQETRSERVLDALRNLASPRALVLRDGERRRIPGRDVVPGDIVILSEGDRVAADGILIDGLDLLADESLLTGESVPVRKRVAAGGEVATPPGGDDQPFVFAGTLVARGSGLVRVSATGLSSEMGKIGKSLQAIAFEQPHLQAQLGWLVRDFALLGVGVAALVVLLFGLLRGSWLNAALGGISIGMSMMPEEIPLVLAVFMAMGSWRISRTRVLTRKAAAIETLGSATVLCTDKTGTLTENRMRVELAAADHEVWRRGDGTGPGAPEQDVLLAALGASAPIPVDPMDRAIQEIAASLQDAAPRQLLRSYGIRPELFATTNVWSGKDEVTVEACAKGAPEAIFELCRLPDAQRVALLRQVDEFAAAGMRLLGVAKSSFACADGKYPGTQRDIPFSYVGLVGFVDPLRATVPAAVEECRTAGIRVIMITGDYPATAMAIAKQAGIDGGQILSGADLDAISDADLTSRIASTSVFARVRPQQKLRLVEALKKAGEIVAMTGDGVNDAPAMKAAHIGIAMGSRGTDVAREAASLVLLDDDFASIVKTIRLGRRIYDNLRKAIEYIVAVHIPLAGLALLPFFLGLPLILMPVQIALIEMVIDPTCSVVFECEVEEDNVMRRPPRKPGTTILPGRVALWPAAQGALALVVVALALLLGARSGMTENDLRALVFTTLVLTNIGLIFVNRSYSASLALALFRPNRALWVLVSVVLLVLTAALYWHPAQNLFHFAPLHFDDLVFAFAAAAGLVGFLETCKRLITQPRNE